MNRSIGLLFIWSLCFSAHLFALPEVKTPYWESMQSAGSNAFDSLKKHPRIIAATAAFLFAAKFGISAYKNTQDYRIQRKEMMLNYYISQYSKGNGIIIQSLDNNTDKFNLSYPPQQPDIVISHTTENYNVFHPLFNVNITIDAQNKYNIDIPSDKYNSPLYYLEMTTKWANLKDDYPLKMAALDFILSSDRDKEQLLLETNGRLFFYISSNYLTCCDSEVLDSFYPKPNNIKNWRDTGWKNLAMMPESLTSHTISGLNRWGKALEWAREYIKAYPKLTRWNVRYGWLGFL